MAREKVVVAVSMQDIELVEPLTAKLPGEPEGPVSSSYIDSDVVISRVVRPLARTVHDHLVTTAGQLISEVVCLVSRADLASAGKVQGDHRNLHDLITVSKTPRY